MLKNRRQFLIAMAAGLSIPVFGGAVAWYLNPFRRRIDALRAAGQPVSLTDLKTDPVPDDQNAAVLLQQAAADLEKLNDTLRDPVTFDSLADKRLHALTAPEILKIEQQLLAQPGLADQVAKVAAAPFAWHDIPKDVTTETFLDWFPEIIANRNAARYLACRARHLAQSGDHEEAIESCIKALKIADQTAEHPIAITYLVRIAIRRSAVEAAYDVVDQGSTPQHSLDSLEKALTQTNEVLLFEEMLRAERAYFITGAEEAFRKEWYRIPFSITGACDCLDFYEAQFGLIDRPYASFTTWFNSQPTAKRNPFSLELMTLGFSRDFVMPSNATAC